MSILRIVSTPIGNLNDFSRRSLDVLNDSEIIFVENIGRSKKMFNAVLGERFLKGRTLVILSQYLEKHRIKKVKYYLTIGKNVTYICDAGIPSLNDPGSKLVSAIRLAGFQVEIFPGVSSLTAALMGSGLRMNKFVYLGFLSKNKSNRENIFRLLLKFKFSFIFLININKLKDSILEMYYVFGCKKCVIARELTKINETFHVGVLGREFNPPLVFKGEVVILVENN